MSCVAYFDSTRRDAHPSRTATVRQAVEQLAATARLKPGNGAAECRLGDREPLTRGENLPCFGDGKELHQVIAPVEHVTATVLGVVQPAACPLFAGGYSGANHKTRRRHGGVAETSGLPGSQVGPPIPYR